METHSVLAAFWSHPADRLLTALHSTADGLTSRAARRRLNQYGTNVLGERRRATALTLLLNQFRSPLVLILIFAAAVAFIVHDILDAVIVLAIVFGSALLGFGQEYRASHAVEKLRARLTVHATVLRDGAVLSVPAAEIVPGDVVLLSAGSLIPADGVVLEAKDLFLSQAVLTGETFPAEKKPGTAPVHASLAERANCVFMGSSVRSGTGRALIVRTGTATAYGQIARRLSLRPPETGFEQGIRRFGYLLTQVMFALVLAVLAVNLFLHRPTVESLLFAVALAVGLSPELLPAIMTITLAKGAQDMAARGVIVRRLNAIENLGSMDVLCTDKTGTLTEGVVRLDATLDTRGRPAAAVERLAFMNSRFQTGLANPLDEAILRRAAESGFEDAGWRKVDEIPYDFVRKRLSVVVQAPDAVSPLLIAKGALGDVLAICDRVELGTETVELNETIRTEIVERFRAWSGQGHRVLGMARKTVPVQAAYTYADEHGLVFVGFLLFFDPPDPGAQKTLADLGRLGVELKIITGDNRLVAAHLLDAVGMKLTRVITGAELNDMRDEALWHLAGQTNLFAEVDPNQKERIILALQKTGHVVGYMGDGINDAPALHAADVGISVDKAVDVAKEAADFVLIEHDLDVLRRGIEEGRTTFANTLKYISVTTSANFGNMVSMAAASLFLPFLPLLAKQILLNNFLSDIPSMAIAGDNVDPEWQQRPHRWDIRAIRSFMVTFGLVSSAFDFLTFGALLALVGAAPELFRTGWFVESLLTELLIMLVVRTHKPFYHSRPGRLLLWTTLAVMAVTLLLPYLPIAAPFAFVPLPASVMAVVLLVTALYIATSEAVKRLFYRRLREQVSPG